MNHIEKQVLRKIGENVASPDAFSDITPIRDSINDAIEEISMVTGSRQRQYKLPLISGQAFYIIDVLDGEMAFIVNARLESQKFRLQQTDFFTLRRNDPRWRKHTGTPRDYIPVSHNQVGFYPIPSASSDVVILNIAAIPSRYTRDNDPIQIRTDFERALVHYAVSEYWASRGDAGEAQMHHQEYLAIIGMREKLDPAADDYRHFSTLKNYTSMVAALS